MEERKTRFGVDPFRGQTLELWQGTVLGCGDGSLPDRLIVSADCDLLRDKGAGEFFSLDVHSADSFLNNCLQAEVADELVDLLVATARDVASSRNPSFAAMKDHVLRDWLVLGTQERWRRDLPNFHVNDIDLLEALAVVTRNFSRDVVAAARTAENEETLRSVAATSANVQLKGKLEQINKKIRKVFEGRLAPTRSDLFVLPPLPGRETSGCFVPFKSLRLMKRAEICFSKVDTKEMPAGYVALGVCRPILIQALLQKLMLYFTRIGLTDHFKVEQEAVVKSVMEKIK